MIKTIRIKNFFSFKEQVVDVQNLNILVGINGSGKSNFIKALRVLKATITDGELENLIINRWGGFDAIYFTGSQTEKSPKFSLEYEFAPEVLGLYGYRFQEPVYYKICFSKLNATQNYTISECFFTKSNNGKVKYVYMQASRGRGTAREGITSDQHEVKYALENMSDSMLSQLVDKDRFYQIYTLRRGIADIAIYNHFDTTENSPIRKPALPSNIFRLVPDGSNLPQLLNWIKINNKSDYRKIAESLNHINPKINGFDFNVLGTNIELLLDEDALNKSVHVTHISDGTLRFLCLMAVICNSKRGKLVCIDEPEIGLHPDMIGELMDAISEVTEESQFILSTHSELILNQTSVSNILVCEKNEENSTEIRTFRDEEFLEWASQYSAGHLWRNGDLGGNRY